MHWGNDPALEKHYVPPRSQRARSVLTFFAQDSGTHNLVYANADVSKANQAAALRVQLTQGQRSCVEICLSGPILPNAD
jgi:hypothetical protein